MERKESTFTIFMESFVSFFTRDANPLEKRARQYREKTDKENIAQDWRNVGNDIRAAYEYEKQKKR